MNKKQGFTLIELVIFIVVIGILAGSILASFNTILRGTARINYQTSATGYAVKCLEWFLGQRHLGGFDNIGCNSTVPNFCNVPSGYTISTNVSCTANYYNDADHYKTITTTISGELGGANLSLIIADY
jgi:prepilin-type N-terminal cleavage/methylation domain-containing protein